MSNAAKPVRWLISAAVLAASAFVACAPAHAQYRRSPGFFDSLFGGGNQSGGYYEPQYVPQADSSRAPAPKKPDTPPTLSVMVFGDSMADWLAYGLEEAFADAPEIGVVRKSKIGSGLLRYDQKSALDWWNVARDELAKEKTDFVVIMLGVNDRQPFREQADNKDSKKPGAKDAKKQGAAEPDKTAEAKPPEQAPEPKSEDDEQPSILAPEPRSAGGAKGVTDFRSERWEQIYTKRIDDMIAAAKSKGVPVIWVGLPSIRGTRSTSDVQYLNQLYRARAEKASITFVDVWDGFVDEGGKFTTRGPDFEGQVRNLRSGDGTHFTKYGARKIAHYVERELRRFISNRGAIPMALPSQGAPATPLAPDDRPGATVRPVAGPVVPLTVAPGAENEELAGGNASRPTHSDATATRVLVVGAPVTPPPGRADDFTWPRPGEATAAIEPMSPTAAAAQGTDAPRAPAKKGGKTDAKTDTKADQKGKQDQRRSPAAGAPRPQQPIQPQQRVQQQQPQQAARRSNDPLGWLR